MTGCLLWFATVIVVGELTLVFCWRKHPIHLLEWLALVALLGQGVSALLLFWLGLAGLGVKTSQLTILTGSLIGCILMGRRGALTLPAKPHRHDFGIPEYLTLLVAAAAMVVTIVLWLASRDLTWDYFAIWAFRAKILASGGLYQPAYFHNLNYAYSHLNYPLLLPYQEAAIMVWSEPNSVLAPKFVYFITWLASIPLAWTLARRWLQRWPAAGVTMLWISLPILLSNATFGLADVPLAVYLLGGIGYLLLWRRSGCLHEGTCGALFLVLSAGIKNEGIAIVLVVGLATTITWLWRRDRRNLKTGLSLAAAVVILLLPLLVWKATTPDGNEEYVSHLRLQTLLAGLPRVLVILDAIVKQTINLHSWGLVWLTLPLLALINWRSFRHSYTWWIWLVMGTHLLAYFLIYMITPWEVHELLGNSLQRILTHLVPAMWLAIVVHLADAWPATDLHQTSNSFTFT